MSNVSKIGGRAFAFAVVAMMIATAFIIATPTEKSVADTSVQNSHIGFMWFQSGVEQSEDGLSWDGQGKLVLDNFSLYNDVVQSTITYGLGFNCDATIELHGTNTITAEATKLGLSCIYTSSNCNKLTICGDGTLNLNAVNTATGESSMSIYALDVNALAIDGATVNINISAASSKLYSAVGIGGNGIDITNGATVNISTDKVEKTTDLDTIGISTYRGDLTITDSKVGISVSKQSGSIGIEAYDDDIVIRKSDVRVDASAVALSAYKVKITEYNSLLGSKVAGEEPTENLSNVRDFTQYKVVWSVYSYNELASGMFVLLSIAFAILVIVAGIYIRKDRH